MREFLDRIRKTGDDRGISLINTPSSFTWEFKGKDYEDGFLNSELIYYVQSITIPDMAVDSGETAGTELQHSSVPSMRMAASQTVQMEIIETNMPIIEQYFLPWMLEAREPKFHENIRSYTYANVTISFREKKLEYKLFGCRPTSCETINPSQRDTTLIRKVTFNVDFIIGRTTQ